jgi:hypothetical protein
MTETFSRRAGSLEKSKLSGEAKARDADDVCAALESAGFEGDALLETKAVVELDRRRAVSDRDAAVSALRRATKEKEQTLRRLRRAQLALARVDEEAPLAREKVAEASVVAESHAEETRTLRKEMDEIQARVDAQMRAYLEEETLGKTNAAAVEATRADAARLRAETAERRRDGAERAELVKRAERAVRSAERRLEAETRIARRTTLELDSKKEIVAESASRLDDLSRRADAQARLRRLAEEQRAKLRRLAAATRKAAFDVGDGLKTLAGEIDALRRDEEDKAADLESARVTLREARRVASLTRNELNRAKETKRAADERLNAETGECFSLTAAVSAARRDLSRFKHDAEALVKNRDAIGVAVLERDDELAALYAKSKTQAEVLKAGELELSKRTEEVRALELELAETQRKRDIAESTAAFVPALHEQVTALRAALAKEKRETERLGAEAEDPSNANRRRDLAGDAPDRDVLRSKLQRLEKQELEHNALLRKKDAALEELAKTSDAARRARERGSRRDPRAGARRRRRAGETSFEAARDRGARRRVGHVPRGRAWVRKHAGVRARRPGPRRAKRRRRRAAGRRRRARVEPGDAMDLRRRREKKRREPLARRGRLRWRRRFRRPKRKPKRFWRERKRQRRVSSERVRPRARPFRGSSQAVRFERAVQTRADAAALEALQAAD